MRLICITGIDGAGKSTLAMNLVTTLNSGGNNALFLYGRIKPVLSLMLMKLGRFAFLRKEDPWTDYKAYSAVKSKRMENPLFRFAYSTAVYIDFYIQVWLKLLPFIFGSKVVILDRYIYDTVISDLAVHLGYSLENTVKSISRALRFIPKPILNIFIDLPEEVAFSRKTDVAHIDYLRERRNYFLDLGKRLNFTNLDGELSREELVQKSLRLIREVS